MTQAEDLALNVVVVGVQHLGDEISAGVLAHCGVVVAQREAGHIEVGSLGLPQTQLCNCLLFTSQVVVVEDALLDDLAVELGDAVDAVGGVGADVGHAHLIEMCIRDRL